MNDIKKEIQEFIESLKSKGIEPSVEEISSQITQRLNVEDVDPMVVDVDPNDRFFGYSPLLPLQLFRLVDRDSPLQIHTLAEEKYEGMPLFRQVKRLLQILSEGDLKLTATGALPKLIVKDLYPLGVKDYFVEKGYYKSFREADVIAVVLTRLISCLTGFAKVRKGVLSITANGRKALAHNATLFKKLFETFCMKFSWAYFDNYENTQVGQAGCAFSLLLLSKYGDEKREDVFYSEKYFEAYPLLLDDELVSYGFFESPGSSCYSVRTFDRFLLHFGLIEIEGEEPYLRSKKQITKTPLFDELISFLPPTRSY